MAVITPTITTDNLDEFNAQLEYIASFADGVHIDLSDGEFTDAKLIDPKLIKRNQDLITHVHVMFKSTRKIIKRLIRLEADLVILHMESDDVKKSLSKLQNSGVRTGVALLPETEVISLKYLDGLFDHVLVFGGSLGHQGGDADLKQLDKVKEIKKLYPDAEVSWDGGASEKNVKQIADAGVSVINAGSAVKSSDDPKKAYDLLTSLVS